MTDDGDAADFKFELQGDVPEGARIERSSGEFVWAPGSTEEPGEYEMTITVTDGGDPPKSDSARLTLSADDDNARFTEIRGIVSNDGLFQAFLYNELSGLRSVLRVGSQVSIADIEGEVVEIESRSIQLQTADGLWLVRLGQNFRSMEKLTPATDTPVQPDRGPNDHSSVPRNTDEPRDTNPGVGATPGAIPRNALSPTIALHVTPLFMSAGTAGFRRRGSDSLRP